MSEPPNTAGTAATGRDARSSLYKRQYRVVGFCVVVGVVSLFVAGTSSDPELGLTVAGSAAGLGVLLFFTSRRYQNLGDAVARVNGAFRDLVAGREEEAEAALDAVYAQKGSQPYVRRAIHLQRTMLAMRRGKLDDAVGWSTKAMEGKAGWTTSLVESVQSVEGRSLRALALASLGRAEEAARDAEAVETSTVLGPSALARVSLARAVILAKTGRIEELNAHYAAEGETLVEELSPRERTLSRALRRMGQPQARSVYREAAILEEPGDAWDQAVRDRDWVRKIAPDAERFVPRVAHAARTDQAGSAEEPGARPFVPRPPVSSATSATNATSATSGASAVTVRAAEAAKPAQVLKGVRRARLRRTAVLWFALIAIFLGLWNFLQPEPQRSHHGAAPLPPPDTGSVAALTALAVAFVVASFAAVVWYRGRAHRRWLQTLQKAQLQLARGDDPASLAALERAAETGGVALGPTSYLALAREAMRRGDTAAAAIASAGGMALAGSTLQARAAHQDIVSPELLSTHAFALAAAGRLPEARADIVRLDSDYPGFAHRARAAYRVDLLEAVQRGDLPAAARIVASREPEMAVELRVDLLGEIACAAAVGGLHDDAAIALQSELGAMPRVASWIEQVAPGLSARIGREHSIRVATPFHSYDDDTIRLDEEAAQLLALGARRPRS